MAKQTELRIIDFPCLALVGKKTTVQQGKTAVQFVRSFRESAEPEKLFALDGRVSPVGDIAIWMGDYDAESKTFTEIPGVFANPDTGAGEYDTRIVAACTMGVCVIRGENRNLSSGAHNKLLKLLENAGYIPDYSQGFSIEYYSRENFEKENDIYEFCYMLPCKRKDSQ